VEGFEIEKEKEKKKEKNEKKLSLVQTPIFFCHTSSPRMKATL